MKKLILGILILGTSMLFAAETLDRSGTYHCQCADEGCEYGNFALTYDRDRQFLTADGKSWDFSGYVSRQESKTTGEVFLTVPATYSFEKIYITFSATGEVRSGNGFLCQFGQAKK